MEKLTGGMRVSRKRFGWAMTPLLVSGALLGQVTLSTVRGVATDTSGAVVAGAGITLTNLETNSKREVKTNGEGDFENPDLQHGIYRLTAAAAGLQPCVAGGIRFEARQIRPANQTLDSGW